MNWECNFFSFLTCLSKIFSVIPHNRSVYHKIGFFFFNKNYGNQLNRNYCGNNPNWGYMTIMPIFVCFFLSQFYKS